MEPITGLARADWHAMKKTGKFVMWFNHELKGQGYRAAMTGVAVSDIITGPYKYNRSLRPNAGIWPVNFPEEFKSSKENKTGFKSWSDEWIKAVKEGKKNKFIYMGDRWTPENLADSRHIWLPVEWENNKPVIKWYSVSDLNDMK